MMNTIHICIAADRNYKLPLVCLVNSIYKNSSVQPCVIHVLYNDLSEKYRNKLVRKYINTNISFDFIDMSEINFDFHGLDMQYWTKTIFYRIMIPEIFQSLDRILYIDGDTLVLGNLSEMFNTKFPDNTDVAMVVDKYSWKTHIFKLDIKNYFNSGMILFDLNKCRENKFADKCVRWLHDNPDKAMFPDQDAINTICDGKILRLNNMYNKQFAPNDKIILEKNPVIIHFLSAVKPWMRNAPITYSKIYRQYIPSKIQQIRVLGLQIIWHSKYFVFHKKYSMKLQQTKILEQIKFYLFNICIKTKTLKKQNMDLIDILKNNKSKK